MSRVSRLTRPAALLAVAGLALSGTDAALADSTNPNYPGSVLHITASGSLREHEPITVTATGTNNPQPQTFNLWIYAVNPREIPGPCPGNWSDMEGVLDDNPSAVAKLTSLAPTEGTSGTFSLPVTWTPPSGYAGALEFCAYSVNVYDTAANAATEVTLAAAGASGTAGAGMPRDRTRPTITRRGRALTCHAGEWSGTQLSYRYRWSTASAPRRALHSGARFTLTGADTGRALLCTVTATSAGHSASATSRPDTVR